MGYFFMQEGQVGCILFPGILLLLPFASAVVGTELQRAHELSCILEVSKPRCSIPVSELFVTAGREFLGESAAWGLPGIAASQVPFTPSTEAGSMTAPSPNGTAMFTYYWHSIATALTPY